MNRYCKNNIDLQFMDNMKLMAIYPDNYFDLAIVDPPYGIDAPNMQMGTHKTRTKDGYPGVSTAVKLKKAKFSRGSGKLKNRALNTMSLDWDIKPKEDFFEELFRVSKNQIIMGGNYFDLPPTRGIFCWDKVQPWDNFSQWEMGWTSFDVPAKIFKYSNKGGNNLEEKIHPTQKPVELYEFLLNNYAEGGNKILDTHLGSGSIAIACEKLGFELTACEIDKKYFSDAVTRVNHAIYERESAKAEECVTEGLGLFEVETTKMIKDLKKGNKFLFNDQLFVVRKKYRNDDSPLITECGELFHHDELEIEVEL